MTALTLMDYDAALVGSDGLAYEARACGHERPDGMWEGWIEFEALGAQLVWRTPRETTQPNLADLVYCATGVSAVYLEGALSRAMQPPPRVSHAPPAPPAFDGPADEVPAGDPVLDPFDIYASKGEAILRRQLGALAAWHLRTIARSHRILPAARIEGLDQPALIEAIVAAARAMTRESSSAADRPR
jgi:hypothetical protein